MLWRRDIWKYQAIRYQGAERRRILTLRYFCANSLRMRRLGGQIQYIPRNMHTVFALLCFVAVIHWLIFPYPPGLLHWHCGNLTIAPVPAKQPWWIWINTSCEFIMNDCITTTKQSTTKPCAYFLGYTVSAKTPRVCTLNVAHDDDVSLAVFLFISKSYPSFASLQYHNGSTGIQKLDNTLTWHCDKLNVFFGQYVSSSVPHCESNLSFGPMTMALGQLQSM